MDIVVSVLLVITMICVVLPPKYDPAIRLKEYFDRKNGN